ncbi:zinc-ribbon domain-containing protein [Muricoccus radiodurans]|uniref:zinc-ribbon domain-containing protein n=1 Tax=Muricoccus radiodurans TaxID=2231721 RepID=UPI003CE67EB9
MRVACPNCAAEYDLPPAVTARLAGGKTVRCTRCGTSWAPELPSPERQTPERQTPERQTPERQTPERPAREEAAPRPVFSAAEPPLDMPRPPAPAPLPPKPRAEPVPVERPQPRAALGIAWAASLLILAGAAYAAWHWRAEVVAAWPPAARAYMALGLAG